MGTLDNDHNSILSDYIFCENDINQRLNNLEKNDFNKQLQLVLSIISDICQDQTIVKLPVFKQLFTAKNALIKLKNLSSCTSNDLAFIQTGPKTSNRILDVESSLNSNGSTNKELYGSLLSMDLPDSQQGDLSDLFHGFSVNSLEAALHPPSIGKTKLHSQSVSQLISLDSAPLKSTSYAGCQHCKGFQEEAFSLMQQNTELNSRVETLVSRLKDLKTANEMMEGRFEEEKTKHTAKIAKLEVSLDEMSGRIDQLLHNYQDYRRETEVEFHKLCSERQSAQVELNTIEKHYKALIGKRMNISTRSEDSIQLPSSKVDLELFTLQLQEELISTKIALDHLQERVLSEDEVHRHELAVERRLRLDLEISMQQRLSDAQQNISQLTAHVEELTQDAEVHQAAQRSAEQVAREATHAKALIVQLEESRKKALNEVNQLRIKVASLQEELGTTEGVQKDFVVLSQNLQMELEKQRSQNHEVRWQDPEDVDRCSSCSAFFSGSPGHGVWQKTNCRHCGHIFCPNCLTKSVPHGPRGRLAQVCDVCHTLLVKDAAPFFSDSALRHNSQTRRARSPERPLQNRLLDLMVPRRTPETSILTPRQQRVLRTPSRSSLKNYFLGSPTEPLVGEK